MSTVALAAAALAAASRPVIRIIVAPVTALSLVLALLVVAAGIPVAFAQDPGSMSGAGAVIIAPTPSIWDQVWNAVFVAIAPIVVIVIGWVGVKLRAAAEKWFGAEAALAANQSYKLMLLAGAGLLRQKWVAAGKDPAMFDRFVEDVLAYLQNSWGDELDEAEPRIDVVRQDLLAAFGELMAKG